MPENTLVIWPQNPFMTRSVTVETHNETTEQPSLFDTQSPPPYNYIRYRIHFRFFEKDTLVFQKSILIDSAPRDWHFKKRLVALIEKEITADRAFKFTKWNQQGSFTYTFTLVDSPGILHWMKKREALRLFDAY